jgi:tetratricopeptide (TPR) repeat protein
MKFFASILKPGSGLRRRFRSADCLNPHAPFQLGRCRTFALALVLAGGFRALAGDETNAVVPVAAPANARDFYNAGTKLLAAKKFSDAEKMFQAALAAQDERVQPPALYNIGHARFSDGLERLKQGPDAQKAASQGNAALAAGEHALRQSASALADNNLNEMIAAYLEGRGARHDLRLAEKAVSAAMETYGKTLNQWVQAADDFKGAAEMNPADTNAVRNAEIVERGIARLVDSLHKMQEMMGALGQQRQDLGKMLSKLKGQMPAPNAPPGGLGDDDEDDQNVTPGSLAGQKENVGRQGDQMQLPLSPDQASQILDGLLLDSTRRLEMSDKEGKPTKDRKGRNW